MPAAGLDPRDCTVCGSSYQPYRDNQRACSRRCKDRLPDKQAVAKAYRARDDIKQRKNLARLVSTNPDRRLVNLKQNLKLYGLTYEQFLTMLEDQNSGCAICGFVPMPDGKNAAARLHVDHDHESGEVRALLCNGCNRGMGYLGDNPARLRAAADYIEKHKKERHHGCR
jgi:predicted nucleic acid-binding Zn ribbon protein